MENQKEQDPIGAFNPFKERSDFVVITPDGVVQVVQTIVKKKVQSKDLVGKIQETKGYVTPLLPMGCLLMATGNSGSHFIIARHSAVTDLFVSEAGKLTHDFTIKIKIPFQVWRFRVYNGKIVQDNRSSFLYFTNENPFTTDPGEVILRHPGLNNSYENCALCYTVTKGDLSGDAKGINNYISVFWQTPFNDHLDGERQRFAAITSDTKDRSAYYKALGDATINNPQAVNFKPVAKTLGDLIKEAHNVRSGN